MRTLYPTICSADVATSRDFYVALFDLKVVFDSGWYVQLLHPKRTYAQLGIVAFDHESVPARGQQTAQGVLVTFEVDDVDSVYARAGSLGLPIELELRDEDFGQRHFMTSDPDGLLVDVVQLIEPSAEYAAFYVG